MKVGSAVRFVGWTAMEGSLHAVVAKVVGSRVNLAYLTGTGSWLSSYQAPFDPAGATPGSWHWPDE